MFIEYGSPCGATVDFAVVPVLGDRGGGESFFAAALDGQGARVDRQPESISGSPSCFIASARQIKVFLTRNLVASYMNPCWPTTGKASIWQEFFDRGE